MTQLLKYGERALDRKWALDELMRLDCEENLYSFLQHAWPFIDSAPFTPGWVVEALAEHLEAVCDGEIRRLLINIPPRCSKSSICSVAFPAWVWAQRYESPTSGPRVPFLHASYGYNLSLRDSVKCRRLIKSTWYRKLWGDRFEVTKEQDQKIRFRNSRDGERLITSIGSGVTGEGGNIIVVDDANAADEALSPAVIKTTNEEWWDGTMGTRLNDPKTGAFIVVQQRLGEEDLTGHILEREGDEWTKLILPMEHEPARAAMLYPNQIGWIDPRKNEGELLWPERFGKREVDAIARRLSPFRAAGQLQQRPEPAGGGLIKRKDWMPWPPEGENPDDLRSALYPACDYILASLDTAYTENTMNDPSALTIWGVFSGEQVARDIRIDEQNTMRVYGETSARVILLYAWQGHLDLHSLVMQVASLCRAKPESSKLPGFPVDKLLIEGKASGLSVAQEMRRLFSGQGFSINVIDPKNTDKIARLYSVQHLFEEKMIYAPDRPYTEMVIDQCGTFPNARHDDLVDTVSMALRHLRDMGLLTRGPEVTEELTRSLTYQRAARPLYPGSR